MSVDKMVRQPVGSRPIAVSLMYPSCRILARPLATARPQKTLLEITTPVAETGRIARSLDCGGG